MIKRREWKNRIRDCLSALKTVDSVYTTETEKTLEEQDADLIEECIETMSYLHGALDSFSKHLSVQKKRVGRYAALIAAAACVLLAAFLAFTPIGKSIAESVVRFVGTIFEDGTLVISKNDHESSIVIITDSEKVTIPAAEQVEDESEDLIVYVDSFSDFTEATGKSPFTLPLEYTELFYDYDESIDYLSFFATYDAPGGTVVTFQIWCEEDLVSMISTGFTAYEPDETIYYSIEPDQGYIHCKKLFEESVFSLSSKSNYTLEELIGFLKDE